MAKETFSVKLDGELSTELKNLQKEYDSGQTFGEAVLLALKEKRLNEENDSPVKAEQLRVRKALTDVERLVAATLEIAASDKLKAQEEARATVEAVQAENAELKEIQKNHKLQITTLGEMVAEKSRQIENLEQSAESVASLKEAWEAKEQALTARIAELDSEAQTARKLQDEITELTEQLREQGNRVIQLQHEKKLVAKESELTAFKQFQGEKDGLIKKYESRIEALNAEIQRLLAEK